MDIYFAVVSAAGTTPLLETRYIGRVSAYRAEDVPLTQVPVSISRPEMSRDIIAHLLYRGGKTIVGREPLLGPHGPHAEIHDNPQDHVQFSDFYVGITTDFWVRACQHSQNMYRRMYVVYRTLRPPQATGNLEVATIRHFQAQPRIHTMNGHNLENRNTRGGDLSFEEYLYLIFR
jgi:hypothetical protein